MSETPRALLARADAERTVARWADNMMNTLRIRRPVKLAEMRQRGPFGRRGKYLYELEDQMPAPAVDALYRALRIVRDEAESKAAELESRVTTEATR